MEGKVLASAFEQAPEIARIPSWETVSGNDGRLAAEGADENPAAAEAALRQLIDLGYVAAPSADVVRNIARAENEAQFNVAGSLLEGGRITEAKEILDRLTTAEPDELRYWSAYVQACLSLNATADAERASATLERLAPGTPQTVVLRGVLAWTRGDIAGSDEAFHEAERLAPNDPMTQTYLGRLYLRQRRWAEAERAFRRALEQDPDSAEAHYGLSVALPRQDRVEEGIDHALLAVGLRFEFPEAHFQLGAVLSRLGWFERAAQAFEISLRLRPGFLHAHRYLSRIYPRLERNDLAEKHQREAARLVAARAPQPAVD
jgi:tetratricopeptide (TPR) repeat protein